MQITVRDLLKYFYTLEYIDVLKYSFSDPHFYNGVYDCITLVPSSDSTSVGELIDLLECITWRNKGCDGDTPHCHLSTLIWFAEKGQLEYGVGYNEYDGELTDIRKYFYGLINNE